MTKLKVKQIKNVVDNFDETQQENAVEKFEANFEQLEKTVDDLSQQIVSLTQQLAEAKRREQIALADYQNLVRRTNEERNRVARLAARNFIEDMLQPLSHLTLASQQLNDAGLNMVLSQLWQALEQNGLKKIDAIGKEFDVNTMEVADKGEKGQKVTKIISDGYTLNEEVIQYAKVILD